jgi:transcriptional regulator with XRE-family HTH domain
MNERRNNLLQELRDRQYRETYAEQHVNSLLATQISTIREQRGLTQAELAAAIRKQQPAISRIENVNYARWNIETLRRVASALGCWLNVRLESWGHLVEDANTYTVESLRRNLIEDDPAFFGSEAVGFVPEPVRWMQARVLPWLNQGTGTLELRRWLAGSDLPPVGDAEPPLCLDCPVG